MLGRRMRTALREDSPMTHSSEDPLGSFAPGLFAGKTAVVTGGGRGIGGGARLRALGRRRGHRQSHAR
jgi:F0F1-type ATP synthase membrane subunit c/vacuolar-type H+-ATPase subunit K